MGQRIPSGPAGLRPATKAGYKTATVSCRLSHQSRPCQTGGVHTSPYTDPGLGPVSNNPVTVEVDDLALLKVKAAAITLAIVRLAGSLKYLVHPRLALCSDTSIREFENDWQHVEEGTAAR